jgi:hypothetical protein
MHKVSIPKHYINLLLNNFCHFLFFNWLAVEKLCVSSLFQVDFVISFQLSQNIQKYFSKRNHLGSFVVSGVQVENLLL